MIVLSALTAVIALLAPGFSALGHAQSAPVDFVFLGDIDPTIPQDIRYAGGDNFTGKPLPGYETGACMVKRAVGQALQQVQRDLAPQGLSLLMLDCYRPVRAVRAMRAWSNETVETPAQKRFYPALNRKDLFRLGYIAARSGHSTGSAVDLTVINARAGKIERDSFADCRNPAAQGGIDMGTSYDCFDVKAHTKAASLTDAQRRSRSILVSAMAAQGFVNYAREWWHFSMPGVGGITYDFPIKRVRH
jgi:D-alanyl-D-alanine dipeptidase